MTDKPTHWACGHWSDAGPESCPVCEQLRARDIQIAELREALCVIALDATESPRAYANMALGLPDDH